MIVNKILDYGNCGIVRFRGKEAYVKVTSLWRRTSYKADVMGELAQHNETHCSVVDVKDEIASRKFIQLPREVLASCVCGLKLPRNRNGRRSNVRIEGQGVSRDRSKLLLKNGELEYRSFKLGNPRIMTDEGLNQRSGNNRNYLLKTR